MFQNIYLGNFLYKKRVYLTLMSRIFPDSDYNIYESLSDPRSKSEWGYGFESSNNPEYINYKQFIDKLDQHIDKDFKIWLGTDPYNPKSFAEICIFDQKNGNFHLIEYFPFKYRQSVNFIFDIEAFKRGNLIKKRICKGKESLENITDEMQNNYLINIDKIKEINKKKNDKGQLSDVLEKEKNDLLKEQKKYFDNFQKYTIISDNPIDRLTKFSYGILDSIELIDQVQRKSFMDKNIHKYFFFGNLEKGQCEEYFITTDKEKETYKNHKGFNYGKGIQYFSREEFESLIDKINSISKNPIWKPDKHVQDIEFDFLPVIKAAEIEGEPKKLSDIQLKHVNRKAFSNRMRISGVAGSGKTFCLTHRAMNYANNDKKVLFTYYTSSFKSYINGILKQPPIEYKRRVGIHDEPSIKVENLHKLLYDMLMIYYEHLNHTDKRDDEGKQWLGRKFVPEKKWPNEVSYARKIIRLLDYDEELFFDAIGDQYSYDAILVDEGQNFKSEWFTVLKRVGLRNRPKDQAYGDMMVAFDEEQKLFGDNDGQSIKELMNTNLIKDPLLATYRIPAKLFEKINLIRSKLGLKEIEYHIPNRKELDYMSEGEYEWINIPEKAENAEDKSKFIVENTLKIIKEHKLKHGDCAIIVDDHVLMAKIQDDIAHKLKKVNIETITDDAEILDEEAKHTTMILTECEEKHKSKLYDLLIEKNDWMLKSKDYRMETYKYDSKNEEVTKRRSYNLLDTNKFTFLFHLYESEEEMKNAISKEWEKEDEEGEINPHYIPEWGRTPKLFKGGLDKISDIKYEKAYQWDKKDLPTHKLTRTAEKLRNRNLKKGYDFTDKDSLITHTIKSFQGQELAHIFIYISTQFNKDNLEENKWKLSWDYENYVNQLFVALTRARRSAWIYNDSKKLDYISSEFNR